MESQDTGSVIGPLLQNRVLRVLLLAGPGIMATVAVASSALGAPLALVVIVNAATGVVISATLFIAAAFAARRIADDRVTLAKAAEEGQWRARMKTVAIRDEENGLYTDWYFRLRVQEELDRAGRHELNFTVVLGKPSFIHNELDARATTGLFYDRVRGQLRGTDLPAILRDGTLAVMLPHTKDGSVVAKRLSKALEEANFEAGCATYPGDGDDVDTLLRSAARAAMEIASEKAAAVS